MSVKLLTEHHLEFLSLKGGYTGSSESTLMKMPHCWKSYVAAQLCNLCFINLWPGQPTHILLLLQTRGHFCSDVSTMHLTKKRR